MVKLLYKPVSMLAGVLGGMAAGAIFKRIWKLAAGEGDAPKPTDAGKRWPEVLAAAALHGAIFAVVKAAVDRGTAVGTLRLTGTWPGTEHTPEPEGRGRGKRGRRGREQEKGEHRKKAPK